METTPDTRTVVVQSKSTPIWIWVLAILLIIAIAFCFMMALATISLLSTGPVQMDGSGVQESFESGDATASDKLAIIDVVGTIMPPLTGRVIEQAEHAAEDDDVKAVLLRVDSPGGLVADSHQIYHKLKQLSDKKPVYCSFGRLAASGGYYVAMGIGPEGKIFVEPTTWTGSIGVIIPHYEVDQLTEKLGIEVAPLTTGEFKDALSPFKDLAPKERQVWDAIIADAFDRFRSVIETNRATLDSDAVLDAATGQIFTSAQALERGLVDTEGWEEDAIESLKNDQGLASVKVVRYTTPPTFLDVVLSSVEGRIPASSESALADRLLNAMTPQPLYLFGWPTVDLRAGSF